MQSYGSIAAVPVSAMPIILHPLIFFAKLSKMSHSTRHKSKASAPGDATILAAILLGRVIKYSIMAQMALTAPQLLRFFGASQETIQQAVAACNDCSCGQVKKAS